MYGGEDQSYNILWQKVSQSCRISLRPANILIVLKDVEDFIKIINQNKTLTTKKLGVQWGIKYVFHATKFNIIEQYTGNTKEHYKPKRIIPPYIFTH